MKWLKSLLMFCLLFSIVACSANNTSPKLSEQQAKEIAFKHANLTEDQVEIIQSTNSQVEDHVEYNLEFTAGGNHYTYRIHGDSGDILDYTDNLSDDATNSDNTSYKTKDEALAIAIAHANLKQTDVTISEVTESTDEDGDAYDIEFEFGASHYEYKVHKQTGEILEYSVE